MPTVPVTFVYLTGIKPELFSNVRLCGSWDGNGRYSEQWSQVPMASVCGEDGCPSYSVTVSLDPAQSGPDGQYYWGVLLKGPAGDDIWGIATEVHDHLSTDRRRAFRLLPGGPYGQEVRYHLNQSRWLGAQKFERPGHQEPGIRFAVWAPNAKSVEVVMATLWDESDPDFQPATNLTPGSRGRATLSLPRQQICGGYIADDHSGVHPTWGPFPMTKHAGDVWYTDADDPRLSRFKLFDHSPYMFRVTKDDGSVAYRTDLYSRCQIGYGADRPHVEYRGRTLNLDGSVSCSVVVDPDLIVKDLDEPLWPEQQWLGHDEFWNDPAYQPQRPVPQRIEDLVIYELHVGALGFGKPQDQPGTLEDAMTLLDQLVDLGVNAVELLPMSEYGGGGAGWGYATSHYFAIEYSGGGRDNYKWFVRECHKRGLAVILDVVYNHYNHSADRAEWMYDTNSHQKNIYYWYEGQPDYYGVFNQSVEQAGQPERIGTGGYLDNLSTAWAPRYHEEMVRKMFVSSAVALAIEFHLDGFRMDQTTSIRAYNALHANGQSVGNANAFGRKLLRELTRTLKMIKPEIMLMAEDHSNSDMVTVEPDHGGLGFDETWYADFYHHLIGDTDKGNDYAKLIKTAGLGDDRALAMTCFSEKLKVTGSNRVVYNESHDEAGNGKLTHRTIMIAVNAAPLVGDTRRYAESRCRFAWGMTLFSAGTPMFLFGEEVGAAKDFLYGKVLENREDLQGLRKGDGKSLFRAYQDMIRLRLNSPGLRSRNIEILDVHDANRVLAFRRWDQNDQYLVIGSLNNQPFDDPGYVVSHPHLPNGRWREVYNSDSDHYGGWNQGNSGAIIASQAGSFESVIPRIAVTVFKKVD